MLQCTLGKQVEFSGIGLHSGGLIEMVVSPANANTGIIFMRTDLKRHNKICARFDNVVCTRLCTAIANREGVVVYTIEHLLSALWACGIDNALIELNGKEVPIMDGSARGFVRAFRAAQTETQEVNRKILKIRENIRIGVGDSSIEIEPSDSEELTVSFNIDFKHSAIGQQSLSFREGSAHNVHKKCAQNNYCDSFDSEISSARTFSFIDEVERLQKTGLAAGASLNNGIGLDRDKGIILNREGLRYKDEFVRHKILDCIGDLYLAGNRIHGHVNAQKSGHYINNQLLCRLFSNEEAYAISC